jgi:cob(I)alamin adenosyltransferase
MSGITKLGCNVVLHRTGKGFYNIHRCPYSHEEHRTNVQAVVRLAKEKSTSGVFDMIILDEINNALLRRLVVLTQIIEPINAKLALRHLVLTGRDAHPEIVERANTTTEMREIKHTCWKGIGPQKGTDY